MLTPWEDEPDDARKRKPYARPARSYHVGALTYPDREECGPTEIVPYLKLRGRWLDKLGFDVGARLKVEATHGRWWSGPCRWSRRSPVSCSAAPAKRPRPPAAWAAARPVPASPCGRPGRTAVPPYRMPRFGSAALW